MGKQKHSCQACQPFLLLLPSLPPPGLLACFNAPRPSNTRSWARASQSVRQASITGWHSYSGKQLGAAGPEEPLAPLGSMGVGTILQTAGRH